MIWLMRHGCDDESRIGGWSDAELTKDGIRQVKEAKMFIKNNVNFKDIVSSDVKRAKQTAQILNDGLNKKIIYTSSLREQNKGDYNGILKSTLKKDDYFLDYVNIYDTYPKGESLMDLYFRIENLLLVMDKWDNDLLVTHRGVINMVYYLLNNRKPDMYKDEFGVRHASIHKLDLKSKKIERIY